jgi:hypothetical protein
LKNRNPAGGKPKISSAGKLSDVIGDFIGTGIDYLGEAGRFPSRGHGSGFIDIAGGKTPDSTNALPTGATRVRQKRWREWRINAPDPVALITRFAVA